MYQIIKKKLIFSIFCNTNHNYNFNQELIHHFIIIFFHRKVNRRKTIALLLGTYGVHWTLRVFLNYLLYLGNYVLGFSFCN